MSRFDEYDDDYDSAYPNQADLWHANTVRALNGKRGKKALAELREALLALPDKRLIAGALCTVGGTERPDVQGRNQWGRQDFEAKLEEEGQGVCAIGAYLWFKKVKAGADPQAAFLDLPILLDSDGDGWATAEAGRRAGLTYVLAYHLAYRNDESLGAKTPEERYDAFLAWIDSQLDEAPARGMVG